MTTDSTAKTKIHVNGQEYASVDEMRDDVRQVYERATAQTTSGEGLAQSVSSSSVAIGTARPGSTRAWLFLAALVMALWLLASFELGR